MNNDRDIKKGITVYCGSSEGLNPLYCDAAEKVGCEIAKRGLTLIYGGGYTGLMGAAGRSVRENGGKSIAVIPQFMVDRGWNDPEASQTIVTPSMHVRKQTMADLARGAIALPGGIGTFEELCEIITWKKLGLFNGNIVILNVEGYYDPLLLQLERAVDEKFFSDDHNRLYEVTSNAIEAVRLAAI